MRGKICSLLPSATEIVFALGLDDQLVGVTHECDFPQAAQRLPVVTRSVLGHEVRDSRVIHRRIATALHEGSSLYVLDQDLLERLDPELILTQELSDVCAVSTPWWRKLCGGSVAGGTSCRSSRRVSAEYWRASSRWLMRPALLAAGRPW